MDWSDARNWLAGQGFVAVNDALPEPFLFLGSVETQFGPVQVRLFIQPSCISFPTIQLVRKPGWLPENCGHLNESLVLCCTDKDTSAPDRRVPQQVVEHVLLRTRQLLEELVVCGGYVADEFVKLWDAERNISLGYLASDVEETDWDFIETVGESWLCVAPSSQMDSVQKWLGTTKSSSCLSPIQISLVAEPRASGPGWPITCLCDLMRWLGQFDPWAQNQLKDALRSASLELARVGLGANRLFVLLKSGSSLLGLIFDTSRATQWLPQGARHNPSQASRQIYASLLRPISGGVTKRRFLNVGSKKMLGRTMGDDVENLAGRRIILIGAGSVGSHLGMALARSGAGADGGELIIYDDDHVSIENIPRSAFDSRHIGENKADSLASMLIGTLIGINIVAVCSKAPVEPGKLASDLIIDASGDHAYSCWLSEQITQGLCSPALFCWVSGQGAAAVTYLHSDRAQSCLACLAPSDPTSQWNPLRSEVAPQHNIGPCGETYMPYSIAAPMTAAGLAVSHALDWVRGEREPFVRSMILSPSQAKQLPSTTPDPCDCVRGP